MTPTVVVETWIRLPGMLCTAAIFQPLEAYAEPAGRVLDVPLAGRSLDEASRSLLQRAHDAPGPVGVIGLSLGGIVTMAAAVRDPAAFAALVLLSTSARGPSREQRAWWLDLDTRVGSGDFRAVADELSPPLWAPDVSEERRLWGRDQALAVGAEAFRDQLAIQQSRHDLRRGLAGVSVPTLVIAGDADQLCPVERHREIARLSGGELHRLAGVGHLSTVERPDLVSAAIGAWRARPAPAPDRSHDTAASSPPDPIQEKT